MRAIIEGVEGGSLDIFKGSNVVLDAVLLSDDGTQIDITGGTLQLLAYDTEDRRNAAIDDHAGAIATATAGYATFTYVPADLNWGPGTNGAPYWGYVKFTTSGGVESVANVPVKINIK